MQLRVPLLFLQGTRDALAERTLMEALVKRLGTHARLSLVEDADHSFHVPARSGRNDAQVRSALLQVLVAWMDAQL